MDLPVFIVIKSEPSIGNSRINMYERVYLDREDAEAHKTIASENADEGVKFFVNSSVLQVDKQHLMQLISEQEELEHFS